MGGAFLREFSGTDEVDRCWFCVGGVGDGGGDGDGGRRGEEDSECVGRRKTKHDGRKGRGGRKKEGGFFYFLALVFLYATFLSG